MEKPSKIWDYTVGLWNAVMSFVAPLLWIEAIVRVWQLVPNSHRIFSVRNKHLLGLRKGKK